MAWTTRITHILLTSVAFLGVSCYVFLSVEDIWSKTNERFFVPETSPSTKNTNDLFYHRGTVNQSSIPTKFLMVTYYRGGSTFLGEMLAQNPSVFYSFEPLHRAGNHRFTSHEIAPTGARRFDKNHYILPNGTIRPFDDRDIDKRLDILVKIYQCELSSLPSHILGSPFFKAGTHAPKFHAYRECYRMQSGRRNAGKAQERLCSRLKDEACQKNKIVGAKVIRLSMPSIHGLIPLVPDIKVIHMVRDPRGILSSRLAVPAWRRQTKVLKDQAYELCTQIMGNYRNYRELKEIYPSSVFFLRYEDLATDTLTWAKRLYNFLGQNDVPSAIKRWIKLHTSSKPKLHNAYGTERNSVKVVSHWKKRLRPDQVTDINESCKKVLQLMNYTLT